MLSKFQTIEEHSEKEIPNENTCEKPSEPHRSFGMKSNATTFWVSDIKLSRMESLNCIIPDASFLVLKTKLKV